MSAARSGPPPSSSRPSTTRRLVVRWLPLLLIALVIPGGMAVASGGLEPGHGLLTVELTPHAPSQVSVDGVPRNVGGIAGIQVPAGYHEVCASPVKGFLPDDCVRVAVPEGSHVTTQLRMLPAGTLNVTTEPASLSAGIAVDGQMRDRGEATVKLTTGDHEVCFEQLGSHISPECQTVTVEQSRTVTVIGTYEPEQQPEPEPEPDPSSEPSSDPTPEPTTDLTPQPTTEPTTQPTATPQPDVTNLLSQDQQTFRGSKSGWTPQGNTIVGMTDDPSYDAAGALVIGVDRSGPWPDNSRTARAGTTPGSKGVQVQPGQIYTGSVRIQAATQDARARCELRWFDAVGKGRIISTDGGAFESATVGEWTQLTCAAKAPDNAATASLRVFLDDVDYGHAFLADDAWLVGGATGQDSPGTPPGTAPTTDPEPPPATDPEPEPEPEPRPAPAPAPSSWPGPDNTGVQDGVTLTRSGSISTNRDGQVIENLEVTGSISVSHSNVTIRNVRVNGTGRYGIHVPSSDRDKVKNLLIEDSELVGVSGERSAALVHYGEWTARRLDISGYHDGVKIHSNQVLESSWIHDLHKSSGSHNDGIQAVGGSNSIIRNNNVEGPWQSQTSAILIQSNNGPVSNYTIEGNRLSGGNYTLYLTDKGNGHGAPSSITVRNNVWVTNSWQFGPLKLDEGPGMIWTGNTYDDGSAYKR